MKKLLALFCIGVLLTSCNKEVDTPESIEIKQRGYDVTGYITPLRVVVIDNCEYLFGDWGNSTVLTHKGDCNNIKHK